MACTESILRKTAGWGVTGLLIVLSGSSYVNRSAGQDNRTAIGPVRRTEASRVGYRIVNNADGTPVRMARLELAVELIKPNGEFPRIQKQFEEVYHSDDDGIVDFGLEQFDGDESKCWVKVTIRHPEYVNCRLPSISIRQLKGLVQSDQKTTAQEVRIEPARFVHGVLQRADGSPAANVEIRGLTNAADDRVKPDPKSNVVICSEVQLRTDDAGSFRIPLSASGAGAVWFFPDVEAPLEVFVPRETIDCGVIQLRPGKRVKGTITDSAGHPVSNLFVELRRASQDSPEIAKLLRTRRSLNPYMRTTHSDAAGTFQLQAVGEGAYELQVYTEITAKSRPAYEGVFVRNRITVTQLDDTTVDVRALTALSVRVNAKNSAGNVVDAPDFRIDGRVLVMPFLSLSIRSPNGDQSADVPVDLKNGEISFTSTDRGAILFRDDPQSKYIVVSNRMPLALTQPSGVNIELIRFRPTSVHIHVVARDGNPAQDAMVSGIVKSSVLKDGRAEVGFRKVEGNEWVADSLVPLGELSVSVIDSRRAVSTRVFKLEEGQQYDRTITLDDSK